MLTQIIGSGLIFGSAGGGSVIVDDTPVGALHLFAGGSIPSGYLLCDGATYVRASYPDLFAVIANTFGFVGATTFRVPNFSRVFPIGAGFDGLTTLLPGANGGSFNHIHSIPGTFFSTESETATETVDVVTQTRSVSAASHWHDIELVESFTESANPPYLALQFIIKV